MNSVRAGSLYSAASAAALLLLCGVDVVAVSGQRSPKFVLILAVLATSVGALQGLCWAAVLSVSARLPAAGAACCRGRSPGLAGASFVAYSLNAFSRFSGRYRLQALAVLLAAAIGGVGLAAVVLGMHGDERVGPTGVAVAPERPAALVRAGAAVRRGRRGLALQSHAVRRAVSAGALVLGVSTWWLCMFGFALAAQRAAWLRVPASAWVVLCAACAACALWFRADDVATLRAFARPALARVRAERRASAVGRRCRRLLGLVRRRRLRACSIATSIRARTRIPSNGIDDNCIPRRCQACATARTSTCRCRRSRRRSTSC